jgi:hypothetical protein
MRRLGTRGETKEDDDEVALEICNSMVSSLSHLGHLFEMLHMFMKELEGVELDGFAEYALGLRNINPKDSMNPKWAYFVCMPQYAKAMERVAPMVAGELERRGVAQRVRARASRPSGPWVLRTTAPRPTWARR